MSFKLLYTPEAEKQFRDLSLKASLTRRFKAVKKALQLLIENPTYPSLNTHKYSSLQGPGNCEDFEAYAENKTPPAYRMFWCYYPPKIDNRSKGNVTILAITPHP